MTQVSRRHFMGLTAGVAASAALPAIVRAGAAPLSLRAETRVIDVYGRAATIMGLTNGSGGQGLTFSPEDRFRVDLSNGLDSQTLIHWHGQIPPNDQDGAPNTSSMLAPGETRSYDFALRGGTYWMHSHAGLQEFSMLAAPLIVRRPEDVRADRQEVVMFLHDFSFKTPEDIMAQVATGNPGGSHGGSHGGGEDATGHSMNHGMGNGMDHMAGGTMAMGGMTMPQSMPMSHGGAMQMDLNDFDFDAYLCNDRTLEDPEVVRVEAGGRVHLRIINGSAMTAYWIDLGDVPATLIAVDGELVAPVQASRFPLAQAQRLELILDMPKDGRALPVLALREGSRDRTGLFLAPKAATVPRLSRQAEAEAPAVAAHVEFEASLRALQPLSDRPVTRRLNAVLAGTMQPYVWSINGAPSADQSPLQARQGERVELSFLNRSMMAHPMHLHGHVFQVVQINGRRISGACRDTIMVPQMSEVTVALDAGEAAPWLLHCHQMAHMNTGMMTDFTVLPSA